MADAHKRRRPHRREAEQQHEGERQHQDQRIGAAERNQRERAIGTCALGGIGRLMIGIGLQRDDQLRGSTADRSIICLLYTSPSPRDS